MKLNFGKRIVLFIHWLVSLALVAALIFPEYLSRVIAWLQSSAVGEYLQIVFIALMAVYSLLRIFLLYTSPSPRHKRQESMPESA